MKDKKKLAETLQNAKEAVSQADKALNDVMQELDLDELDDITGAGNPFGNLPRVPTQPIDDDLRNRG